MGNKHTKVAIEKGEYWWGGTTSHGFCPISENSEYHQDFRSHAGNQTMPLFMSSHGRYIWSDKPFKVDVNDGVFSFEGSDIELVKAGDTLKDSYIAAQSAHFPCDKVKLEHKFFEVPQYNTWMEFTYYPTQNGILEYSHNIIKHGFEPGILIIDEGWHIHTGYGRWEFDFSRFPDPKAMVDELHSMGFYVMLWVTPFVTSVGPDYFRSIHPLKGTDPESAKHLYKRTTTGEPAIVRWWNGTSAILDFTNAYDCQFLSRQLNHLMQDYGVDGFKFDGGSVSAYSEENVINGKFAGSSTPAEMNGAWNEFGRKYRFHEFKDTYMGGGKNSIQRLQDRNHSWTDNGINEIIPCAINQGLIGHPFTCPDMVGGGQWLNKFTPGFEVDEELFVRMAQCSALFPMMQFSWAPWEALSQENMQLCLEAAKLHTQMSDEILKLVDISVETGEPIIRCLEYNDPHQGFETVADEFMLGTDILAAPVVTKNTRKRNVVFPKGNWIDTDGNTYVGRKTYTLDAPLEKLLWFRRITD